MTPKLLIGMAVYDDFDGVYFSIQAMRQYHPEAMPHVEIAVVDNNPGSPKGQATREFLGWVKGDVAALHYLPFTENIGTASTRNKLFAIGSAPAVLCMDPHILFAPGALQKLIDFYAANPKRQDLYHGPLLYDDLKQFSTHFDDAWGDDQMWGKWGTDRRGANADGEAFEIPAMGLGVFTCQREAWLGFNPRFRGFGGEEWYIHEKFRKAGHKVFCLPFLRWLHRFGRPGGVPYPLELWDKARNYVIGLQELGIPLDRAKKSFVGSGKISEKNWQALVDGKDQPVSASGCGCSSRVQPPPMQGKSLDDLFLFVKQTPRDLDQHADYIRSLASQSRRVTAFVKRREWNVILAAARPQSLIIYQKENDPLLQTVHEAVKAEKDDPARVYTTIVGLGADSLVSEIEDTDLLLLDTILHYERLKIELEKHASRVSARILIRGTGDWGSHDEGQEGPGLLPAIRDFIRRHPEWTVIHHTQMQYGLTVLSRDSADKKPLPSLWKQGVNAAKASWRAGSNVLQGFGPLKDSAAQDERLALCLLCPAHTDGRCSVCGCPVDKKTTWPTESCPLGHWGQVDESKLLDANLQSSAGLSSSSG